MTNARWALVAALVATVGLTWWLLGSGAGPTPTPSNHRLQPDLLDGSETSPSPPRADEPPVLTQGFHETEPPGPKSPDASVSCRFVDEDGEPWSSLLWAAAPDDSEVWEAALPYPDARTNAAGYARLPAAPAPPKHWVLIAPSRVPFRGAPPDAEHIRQPFVLPRRATLQAQVLIDGRPPESTLGLVATGWFDPARRFGPPSRHLAGRLGHQEGRLGASTDAHGFVAWYGLESGEVVEVELPRMLRRRDSSAQTSTVPLVVGQLGQVLDLVRVRGLCGTPVPRGTDWADAIQPLRLTVRIEPAVGTIVELIENVSPRAKFEVPLPETELRSIEVTLQHLVTGTVLARRRLTTPIPPAPDLQEIPFPEEAQSLVVTICDDADRPLAGARLRSGALVLGPTGVDGCLRLPHPGALVPISLCAPGRRLLTLPTPPEAELRVRLLRASILRCVLRAAEDMRLPENWKLVVTLPRPLGADAPERTAGFASVRGAEPSGQMESPHTHSLVYDGHGAEPIELSDFPAGTRIQLRLADVYGHLVAEATAIPEEGVLLEVVLTLTIPVTEMKGSVVSRDGRPLPGARLAFHSHLFSHDAAADPQGQFQFNDVMTRAPRLQVSAPNFRSRTVGLPWPPEGRIALDPARTLHMEIVDTDGQRQDAEVWVELPDGARIVGAREGRGLYVLSELAEAAAFVRARNAEGAAAELIPSDQDRGVIILPR